MTLQPEPTARLFPFQEQGVEALLHHGCLLLADDMGLGKTVQAITAMRRLFAQGEISQALVAAPLGLLTQWRREIWAWAPELAAIRVDGPPRERAWKWASGKQVYLAGYETVRSDHGNLMPPIWDLVILDEAQRIKNRHSALAQACKRLRRRRAWVLTGTPLENREDELASILEFVRPNLEGKRLPGLHFGSRLQALHAELQLRRRKSEVLTELPPKRVVRLALELSSAQRKRYQEVEAQARGELSELGETATVLHILVVIARLKQICNFCPSTGQSSKLEDLKERLHSLSEQGERALVFSQWTNPSFGVERLANELHWLNPITYTGALSATERNARIETFRARPEHRVLILSLKAGGQGLNLQEASYVVHFDRWWNPAVENQATERAHRLGQTRAVTVYAYICVNTIEERIEEILDRKRHLFANIVDGVSLDVRRLLTTTELFGLFDLPAPTRAVAPTSARQAPLIDRVRWVLARMGWENGPVVEESRFWASRIDEVGLRQVMDVECPPDLDMCSNWDAARTGRLIVVPWYLKDLDMHRQQAPGVTLWGLTELTHAENLFSP